MKVAQTATSKFHGGDWQSLGVYTGELDLITGHDRLLRSLSFGDEDYSGHANAMIFKLVQRNPANLSIIEDYVNEQYGTPGQNISTAPSHSKPITFTPSVFEVPEGGVERDLIAVMMPFAPEFEAVFGAISAAAASSGFRCFRAKDIWQHSVLIQDVFSLIFKANIVVCDFTDKNANVFYEAGIAHTLGKHVVPITQSQHDIPFDLQHHRYLRYLNNNEGLVHLQSGLQGRFVSLGTR